MTAPTILKVDEGCRSAGIGCIECKGWAADALVSVLNPMQERRKKYEDNPRLAWDILEAGSSRAGKVAGATMDEVREAMGMSLDYEASTARRAESSNQVSQGIMAENLKIASHETSSPETGALAPVVQMPSAQKPKPESDFPFSVMVSDVYEGPLDLLLDLIRKQDIDIYDIPIARITAQYLAYVEKLRELDVNVAAEFIYMAAVLIHIKSKMLLPRDPDALAGAEEDPRAGAGQPAHRTREVQIGGADAYCRNSRLKTPYGPTRPSRNSWMRKGPSLRSPQTSLIW